MFRESNQQSGREEVGVATLGSFAVTVKGFPSVRSEGATANTTLFKDGKTSLTKPSGGEKKNRLCSLLFNENILPL